MPDSAGDSTPHASRPHMPGYGIKPATEGSGLLPWSWAEERLQKSHNFFITTASAEGRPHLMVIWGLWLEGNFLFSTGKQSRKARNLAANPRCSVATENAAEAVILEGTVVLNSDRDLRARFDKACTAKYNFDMGPYASEPIYVLHPERAFGLKESDFIGATTRWTFSQGGG